MLFNSWGYILFLIVVVTTHWLLPHRFRTLLIGLVSLFFYGMWRWEYSVLLLISAMIDFTCANKIYQTKNTTQRKLWLITSLSINLGLLAYFKYTYFVIDNAGALSGLLGFSEFSSSNLGISILLPLGISFYTFQTISYTIDVYRNVTKPAENFSTLFAYVVCWPQLIAGPILRAGEIIPQLLQHRHFNLTHFSNGITLIIIGLAKKIVIADNISSYVDFWFNQVPESLTAIDVWVATFLFGFQIYFDFSGYSDIAIGSALLIGLQFPDNFNWPYMATSPKDLWQRWHISLSAWIRDYLYLPLTGQKFHTKSTEGIGVAAGQKQDGSRNRALLLTWAIMGLWHGANWTFMFWGVYHASVILIFRLVKPLNSLVTNKPLIGWIIMLPITMASWIFFRAETVEQAFTMYAKLVNPFEYQISAMISGMSTPAAGWSYVWAAIITAGMAILFWLQKATAKWALPDLAIGLFRGSYLAILVAFIVIFMQQTNQFIYFQF
jgi:alginate O-acetyltransferase complex protein AlgI